MMGKRERKRHLFPLLPHLYQENDTSLQMVGWEKTVFSPLNLSLCSTSPLSPCYLAFPSHLPPTLPHTPPGHPHLQSPVDSILPCIQPIPRLTLEPLKFPHLLPVQPSPVQRCISCSPTPTLPSMRDSLLPLISQLRTTTLSSEPFPSSYFLLLVK